MCATSTTATSGKISSGAPLAKQTLPGFPLLLFISLVAWGAIGLISSSSSSSSTSSSSSSAIPAPLWSAFTALVVGYAYSDFWMWSLHCFLDRKENLTHSSSYVRALADDFQSHHDHPKLILTEDHMATIGPSVKLTAGLALLLAAAWGTSPTAKLTIASVCLFGCIGVTNHFYCHARTHSHAIPAFYKKGQDWGFLPTAHFHKTHHTAPFDTNWSFLCGGGVFYEALYRLSGETYNGSLVAFVVASPISMILTSALIFA